MSSLSRGGSSGNPRGFQITKFWNPQLFLEPSGGFQGLGNAAKTKKTYLLRIGPSTGGGGPGRNHNSFFFQREENAECSETEKYAKIF